MSPDLGAGCMRRRSVLHPTDREVPRLHASGHRRDCRALPACPGRVPHLVVNLHDTVRELPHPIDDVSALADPEKGSVPKLGIIGIDVADETAALLPALRISSGVFVVARTRVVSGNGVPLMAGDVIHSVNGITVRSIDGLRVLLGDATSDSELVLQVERNGQLQFATCRIY